MESQVPMLAWKPESVEDANLVAQKMKKYTNCGRAFVVFRCGTVVFSDTVIERPDKDYEVTLSAVANQAPDFTVMPMQDGNYLVRFAGPVCGLVLADFYAEHASEIRDNIDAGGLFPGEQVMDAEDTSAPVEHYYIGLFARAKLFSDVSERAISIRFSP